MTSLPAIIVHGGSGEWRRGTAAARDACRAAAEAGLAVLLGGGGPVDAVIAAVRVLEDDPACNAGTGSVLDVNGGLQLDASIMDGSSGRSGAVAVLPAFAHPVEIARSVMDDGRYHLLAGEGAASFAESKGFRRAEAATMITPERLAEHRGEISASSGNTVGAAAVDAGGRLAAATSTGGQPGTHPGRVGDVAIVGAGTYATRSGACSCTGDGEALARAHAAQWTLDHYRGEDLQRAADRSIGRVRDDFDGWGGLIAVDAAGQCAASRAAAVMPHARGSRGGIVVSE